MGRAIPILLFWAVALTLAAAQSPLKGLGSSGPDPALKDKLQLFGQFVGDWTFDVTLLKPDGSKQQGTGEWHFGWVLEGRAIQDVWIANYRHSKPGDVERGYGTTLRFYDSKTDTWKVTWISPLSDVVIPFTARKVGKEIVMESKDGPMMGHWILSDITSRSFRWRAEASRDGGKTWITTQEFSVHRSGSPRR
jgi:hypothetical protein